MLTIEVPKIELFNNETQEFIVVNPKPVTITLEHSLVSISKWESKWHKPFLDRRVPKTDEELKDYIRCMTLTQNVNYEIYNHLPADLIDKINAYLEDPMTATTINKKDQKGPGQIITSELVYYWMIALGVPFECQKWHINRLLTLIEVCNIKNNPKKMSKKDIYSQNAALNKMRRQAARSRG